jgi:hypothetical protein
MSHEEHCGPTLARREFLDARHQLGVGEMPK